MAEDDPEDAEIFQSLVEENSPGTKITVATDGALLVKLLHESPIPDLIVLDINMPRKSGKQCLQEIRNDALYDKVPIIIFSTSTNIKDKEFCLGNGASKFYTKPFHFLDIRAMVAEILETFFGNKK